MSERDEMAAAIEAAGDNCGVCGRPLDHGAHTYIGPVAGTSRTALVGNCCVGHLSALDGWGTYWSAAYPPAGPDVERAAMEGHPVRRVLRASGRRSG